MCRPYSELGKTRSLEWEEAPEPNCADRTGYVEKKEGTLQVTKVFRSGGPIYFSKTASLKSVYKLSVWDVDEFGWAHTLRNPRAHPFLSLCTFSGGEAAGGGRRGSHWPH